jgi:hypothetical protein
MAIPIVWQPDLLTLEVRAKLERNVTAEHQDSRSTGSFNYWCSNGYWRTSIQPSPLTLVPKTVAQG